ncbi:DUF692 family protein [Streptomyces sp. NBC_00247]|uniref:multinuclear nonheme iron-dependent oxidase n=1 Tax=Streptomyces sp. NBC_00247 TaxID=2975689 RepID=UPI002E2E86E3|nr:DUF692 family multinuclear iron-containing protein [Streptomyces sp. NBC_00247]
MRLGIGIGWRPEIADAVEALEGVEWVEAVAENLCADHLPESLVRLRERGVTVVPHGVALGLGGAERPDPRRLADLAARVELLGAPLVTEHIAFVRAGGPAGGAPALEAGHLLPVPRTWDALDVLCENVRIAQDSLPVPLALENIAALVGWPDEELTEGQFLAELVARTGVRLLIDVANLHTNHVNRGEDPATALDELPAEAIAYVHVAGGVEKDGVWHDTHAHPVTAPVLEVLTELRSRVDPPGVLLERDEDFPPAEELAGELAMIRKTLEAARRSVRPSGATRGSARGSARVAPPAGDTTDARERLAGAQAGLLASLVAGAPVPAGFDAERLGVQSRALAAKRAGIVAKVAPELPEILGPGYRPAFLRYAEGRPPASGYRRDALAFAEHLLVSGEPADDAARRRLTHWWQDRAAARPPRRTTRLVRAARAAFTTSTTALRSSSGGNR